MKRLKNLYIEITNICNLSCPFCPKHTRTPSYMSKTDFIRIIENIRGKADVLYFHVKGEPFLHPDLESFIDIANDAGFPVHLTTNGTLLDATIEALSNKANLHRLNVSLHSLPQFNKEEQDRLTRSILQAGKKLSYINRKINPKFLISLRLWTKDNIEATQNSFHIIEDFYHLDDGLIEKQLVLKNSIILEPGIVIHTAETFTWPSLLEPDLGPSGFCLGLRDQAGILVDGTVIPCCLDGEGIVALGNIFTDSWDSIITSQRAAALYKSFSDRKITEPLCRRCSFRTRFNETKTIY